MNELLISGLLLIVAVMLGWIWQVYSKNAGIADVIWSYGVGLSAVFYAVAGEGALLPRLLVGIIAGLWFARLGTHVLLRVLREEEDGRYRAIREHYSATGINFFHFVFFLGQALAAWIFALPMWVIAQNPTAGFSASVCLALGIIVIAFFGEAIADRQLAKFRDDPKNRGKTCRVGLWRYSRHPNYFFEWLHWFAYPLLALGAPYGIYVWFAPMAMFFFLYYITGIPYTERQAVRTRGDDYIQYQRTTSAFIPWRPRV